MWDRLNKLLNFLTPAYDKLKHNYFGNLIYLVLILSSFIEEFSFWQYSLVVIIGSLSWEISQKVKGGTNDLKEMTLDIFYTNYQHSLLSLFVISIK